MMALHTVIKQRLRQSSKEISAAFFRAQRSTIVDCNFGFFRRKNIDDVAFLHQCNSAESSTMLRRQASLCKHFCSSTHLQHRRFYSTNTKDDLPNLTDMPVQFKPNLLSFPKCWLLSFLVIRPQLDRDFSLETFLKTSGKVLVVVANRLAANDYDALEEMVTPDVFNQIKKNLPHFTESQKQIFTTCIEHIMSSYVYDIKVIENPNQREKVLQITIIHCVFKNVEEVFKSMNNFSPFQMMQERMANPQQGHSREQKCLSGYIANLRYVRTYNSENDTATDWTISGLNFKAHSMELF